MPMGIQEDVVHGPNCMVHVVVLAPSKVGHRPRALLNLVQNFGEGQRIVAWIRDMFLAPTITLHHRFRVYGLRSFPVDCPVSGFLELLPFVAVLHGLQHY